jgi:two-component system nitrogen regulation sensor histidine kinase NtrY
MVKRIRRSHEGRVFRLALAAGLPALAAAGFLLWRAHAGRAVSWTVLLALALLAIAFALAIRDRVVRTLQTVANLLGAIRENDYSIRGTITPGRDALSLVFWEINELAATLRQRRLGELESAALLRAVVAKIDTAIFTFDFDAKLRFVNRSAESLLGMPAERMLGRSAAELGLADWIEGAQARTVEHVLSTPGRWSVRRSAFREQGRPHHLVVVTDLRQALREEERQAWQRIIRVLGHELNNSLAPIRSIAESLFSAAGRAPKPDDWDADLNRGLHVIGSRAAALTRFLEGYRQLARLPEPQRRRIELEGLLRRVAALESRAPIRVARGPGIALEADGDQLEQLFINLIRNAADACLETGGGVTVAWEATPDGVEVSVVDEGQGIESTNNLFVPFYTTKPGGSGIGLLLSRQIAEAHGGSLTLSNRLDRPGCVARLRLPIRDSSGNANDAARQ